MNTQETTFRDYLESTGTLQDLPELQDKHRLALRREVLQAFDAAEAKEPVEQTLKVQQPKVTVQSEPATTRSWLRSTSNLLAVASCLAMAVLLFAAALGGRSPRGELTSSSQRTGQEPLLLALQNLQRVSKNQPDELFFIGVQACFLEYQGP